MFNAREFMDDIFGTLHLLVDEDGKIWFIGREVTSVLGYSSASAQGHAITEFVRKEDRKALKYKALTAAIKAILWTVPNDYSDKWVISECGFYDLLIHSQAKLASDFQHWVTHEVLPSIYHNGGYILGQEHLGEEERSELNEQVRTLSDEVTRLRELLKKKNAKAKELKRTAEINRLCRSKYKEALDDIDRMTELFAIEDRYNEYLRQRDIDRDVTMQELRRQLFSLRVLVQSYGSDDLVRAAVRDGLIANERCSVDGQNMNAYHGGNVFLS